MEEKTKKKKIKEILIAVSVCTIVLVSMIGFSVGMYNYFSDNIEDKIETSASNTENVEAIDMTDVEENNEEETADEEQLEEQGMEQQKENEEVEITPEEKKKREEEAKKRQEELEKKRIEEAKKKSQGYPYWIKVNYVANTVTVYKVDENGNYTVPIKAMVCSTGASTPRSGVYRTQAKYAWKALIGSAGKYCTRITGQILFHSVPYLNGDKEKFEYWEYDKLGQTRSLGCIRLTVADALWIYNNCPLGTSVEFYGSSNPGPLGKPSAPKISGYGYPLNNWDPTDPDSNNPWHNYNARKAAEKAAEEAAQKKAEEEAAVAKKKAEEAAAAKKKAEEEAEAKEIAEEEAKKADNKVEVPRVIDYSKEAATKALNNIGLNVEYKEEIQTSGINGVVIKQNPVQGTKVDKGTKITITLRKVQINTNENGKEGDNIQ